MHSGGRHWRGSVACDDDSGTALKWQLVRLLPDWAPGREIIHIAFPTRRGLIPSVRELIDYLAGRFAAVNQD